MKLPDPGPYQRRHRIVVITSLLAALCVLPVWSGLAAGFAAQALLFYFLLPGRPVHAAALAFGAPILVGLSALLAAPDFPSFPLMLWPACVLTVLGVGTHLRHHWALPLGLGRGLSLSLIFLLLGQIALFHLKALGNLDLPWIAALPAALGAALAGLEWLRWRWINVPRVRRASLSVLVVCQDEADRIDECLSRVAAWADEIVVFDSGSSDDTVSRVRQYTDQVFETDWRGYGRQKQRALERCRMDWVLSIDADEYVTEELKREIDAHLSSDRGWVALKIPWVSHVFGGYVFFGADGRYHKRLFRREQARFNGADVHEDIEISGAVGILSAPVVHDTFRNYEHLRQKFTKYAMLSAQPLAGRRRSITVPEALARGLTAFSVLYFRRMGFADGARGLLMAAAYASYTFDKYAAAWSMRRPQTDRAKTSERDLDQD